jgi:hypothetical protein
MRLIKQDRKRSWLWGSVVLLLLAGQEELAKDLVPSSDVRIEITVPDATKSYPINVQVGAGAQGQKPDSVGHRA